MSKVLADYYPRNIDQYVPNMEFAADVVDGAHKVSLGAPATLDADGIWDGVTVGTAGGDTHTSADYKTTFDGSSTSVTTTSGMIDATYGRCLTCVGNASTDQVVTVIGRDYLGQGMRENFTLSGTTVQYGLKAFKFVDSTSCTAGTGGSTLDVGWSDVLGLPYASQQILGWTEDNVQIRVGRRQQTNGQIWTTNSDASLFGSMATNNGFVVGQSYVATVANTTGTSALTVEVATVAVAGLSITVSASESIGDATSDFAGTNDHGATGKIAAGGAIESVSSTGGTAGIGHISYYIDEGVYFIDADRTATMTATTGDTRGTALPYTSCDGSVVYEVEYSVNTADLHGIEQFNG